MTILVRGWEGSSAQPVLCRHLLTLRCDGLESVTREADDGKALLFVICLVKELAQKIF